MICASDAGTMSACSILLLACGERFDGWLVEEGSSKGSKYSKIIVGLFANGYDGEGADLDSDWSSKPLQTELKVTVPTSALTGSRGLCKRT